MTRAYCFSKKNCFYVIVGSRINRIIYCNVWIRHLYNIIIVSLFVVCFWLLTHCSTMYVLVTNFRRFIFAHTGSHTVAFHNEWSVRPVERAYRLGQIGRHRLSGVRRGTGNGECIYYYCCYMPRISSCPQETI